MLNAANSSIFEIQGARGEHGRGKVHVIQDLFERMLPQVWCCSVQYFSD